MLYRHIYLESPGAAAKLAAITREPQGANVVARISTYTKSISLGFRFSTITDPEYKQALTDIIRILNIPKGLQSFICKAPQLSLLPQAIIEALFRQHGKSLQALHGFATGFSAGIGILPFFCGLENIEKLTTGPTWLPRSAPPSDTLIEDLLRESDGKLFSRLSSLYTPMVSNHNVLFDILVGSELPSLRHLRVSTWDRASLHTFLTVHGHKLEHLELKYSWTEETLANKHDRSTEGERLLPVLLRLISLCPQLEQLTLHDCHSFGIISRATSWNHPNIKVIRMGISALEGSWTFPEHQANPQSWCLRSQLTVAACTRVLAQTEWKSILPALERFLVWPPNREMVPDEEDVEGEDVDSALRQKTGWQIIDHWNEKLRLQDVRVDVEGPAAALPST